jgi:ABC-type branched-subunit amino acid transport system substrate-binding protein
MAAPFLVGVLNDNPGTPAASRIDPWLRLAADELRRAGRLEREVELVHVEAEGLPAGTAANLERGYAELAARDVLMVVGPAIGDNALVATPLAERYGLPTLNWAGTEHARSAFMFHLQVGSHEDESIVLARHLHALGVTGRVAVVYDRSEIGRRHFHFLQAEAEVVGLNIAAAASVSPITEDAEAQVAAVLEIRPDAFVYLGLGLAAPAVSRALTGSGWDGPKLMNTCGLRGYDPSFAPLIDGWIYVDMIADDNRTLNDLAARTGLAPIARSAAARGYDLGRLMAEGLARATERTRGGVKAGLEQIKWLPAAEGHEGTLLSFGVQDRGALHGRYLVLREWRGGETVQVAP